MTHDETALRALQSEWFDATAVGDLSRLLALMTEDVVFLTPGRAPFGREEFAANFRAGSEMVALQCGGAMEHVEIHDDVAIARSKLRVTITPRNGSAPRVMSGYALTIFRRLPTGNWFLSQDANLLTPETA